MTTAARKPSIRIIKRNERELISAEPSAQADQVKTESQAKRELVATVTSWIRERQERARIGLAAKSQFVN